MSLQALEELFRDAIMALAPRLVLTGVHGYTVSRDNGDGTFDIAPAPRVLHGPRLRVEQGAAPGVEAGLSVGDKVCLVFVDHDETQPLIVAHMPLRDGKPASLRVDATGTIRIGASASLVHIATGSDLAAPGTETGRVVRFGDLVSVGTEVGAIQSVSGVVSKVKAI